MKAGLYLMALDHSRLPRTRLAADWRFDNELLMDLRRTQIPNPTKGATRGAASINWEHLAQYTMGDDRLAAEIIGLFQIQMPSIVAMLHTATNQQDWRFAVHTLKGSAAAVGAQRIARLVARLEMIEITDSPARRRLIGALEAEIVAVGKAVRGP